MSVLIWIAVAVGGLLALVLLLVVLVLLVPVQLDASWGERRRVVAIAGPGLRLGYDVSDRTMEIRVLALFGRRWTPAPRERKERKAPRKPKRKRRGARISPRKLWAQRRRVVASLATFVRRLRVRHLRVDAILASPDPAVTGWMCGAAYAGRALLPLRWQAGVGVQPDFDRELPSVEVDASLRLQPLQAALLALRLWLVMRRARRRRARVPAAPAGTTDGAAERTQDRATSRPTGGGRNEGP